MSQSLAGTVSAAVAHVVGDQRMELSAVRTRAVTELQRVNSELTQVHCGHLVAVPISAAAREPGPLAEFLIDIGLNPFGLWNTLYYAADPQGAEVMDAVAFRPGVEGAFEAEFGVLLGRAEADWRRFTADPASHDEATVRAYRAALAGALTGFAAAVHDAVYAGRANRWLHFFGQTPRDPAAAPSRPPAGLPAPPLAAARAAAPAAPPVAQATGAVLSPDAAPLSLAAAKAAFETRLAAARRPILPGRAAALVPVALCDAAIRPGPVADWLIAIGADPFGPWNIVLRAGDEATAQALGTPRHAPGDDGRFGPEIAAIIEALRSAWEVALRAPGIGKDAAGPLRASLRQALAAASAPYRQALLGPGDHLWQTGEFGGS
jgi:hypothetical protein